MKRKAIKLSRQTLVVSLPSAWVRRNGIGKGDELEVEPFASELIIRNANTIPTTGTSTTLDLAGLNERTIRWLLSGAHKQGHDEITITYKDEATLRIIEDVLKNLYLGMAIVKETPHSVVIKSLAREDPKQFYPTLRRAFQVTLTMADSLFEAISKQQFGSLTRIRSLEKTNNQLTNFCQRLLNAGLVESPSRTHYLYTISWNLEKVADSLKYICDHLISRPHDIPRDITGYLLTVTDHLRGYYDLFYKFSVQDLNHLGARKESILSEGVRLIAAYDYPENVTAIHLHDLALKTFDFATSMFSYHQ